MVYSIESEIWWCEPLVKNLYCGEPRLAPPFASKLVFGRPFTLWANFAYGECK